MEALIAKRFISKTIFLKVIGKLSYWNVLPPKHSESTFNIIKSILEAESGLEWQFKQKNRGCKTVAFVAFWLNLYSIK